MLAWGVMDVMAGMIAGMASTLGGGTVQGLLDRRVGGGFVGWFAMWCILWCAGEFLGRLLGDRLSGGTHGLQLLATTVLSSLLSLSARIRNGLLLRMWRWWINGICRLTLGAVMLFDVVATLGGRACSTL